MKVKFVNQEHEARFSQFRAEHMSDHYRINKESLSVVYIMTANEELYRKIKSYFNGESGKFDSEKMLKDNDFIGGDLVLARLAVHLFNSNETVEPLHIISRLDDESFKLALNVFILRRYGISKGYDLPEEKLYM